MAADIKIYRTTYCGYCEMAKRLFENLGAEFEEIDVTNDPETRLELVAQTGRRTVPQIFINGESVGGYDDVRQLQREGKLEEMIGA